MNYLREINAFYDWLETNPLSTSSIVLWYALMHINNKTGWAKEFAVAVSVICVKTGLSTRTVYDARNELRTKGRLQWKSRNGNQSALYILQPLCAIDADNAACKDVDKGTCKPVDKPAPLIKLNKTNKEVSNNTSGEAVKKPEKLKPKKSAKPKQPPNPDHQKVMDHYFDSFKNKFGEKPIINGGKDGAIIKNLLATYAAEKIIALLDKFFNSNDSFIRNSGYALGVFQSQINKLLVDGGQNQKPLPREPDPDDKRKRELIKKLY